MKLKLSLIDKVKNFGGLFRHYNSKLYTGVVKEELHELRYALETNDKLQIEEELADVMFQTFMMYEKILEEHNVNPAKMYRSVIRKYKERAPHIFENNYIGIKEEGIRWLAKKELNKKIYK